jgi:hypothetical protein
MKLFLHPLIPVLGFTVISFASDDSPSNQTNSKSPEMPYDNEKPPSSVINGQRFPPGTEIKTVYTHHVWIVQQDGTVKPEADLLHIKGTLTLQGDHLIFSADGATETFDLAKAPGIKAIKFTKKVTFKDEKEVDVSEAIIEIDHGVKVTLKSLQAVPVVKITADGGYVRWTLSKQ